ncbi:Ig-like domain-containing protein [Paenibacillus sp. WQ 127069]|uniref:Ig-like domain-containing protein n=1 Tax=Paenibacillus baimaensis TaxID=2982185 RepID=A0ABT2UB07_9BACL|nr:Ig-like domain-containing protein [Paenibacillus sp. WQ 127069]MCU6791823.1 Ig-like domain-containing protein [Paenibacillus sp. WQ 127069]
MYTNSGSLTSVLQLTAKVEPANADNKAVTWSSSNPAVATVDEDGLVTVHTAGTVVIKVATEDGGFSDTCTVTVNVYVHDDSDEDNQIGGSNASVPTASPGPKYPPFSRAL